MPDDHENASPGIDPEKLPRCPELDGSSLRIVPAYTEAGAFTEANCVTITDGQRTAVYVPHAVIDGPIPHEPSKLDRVLQGVREAQHVLAEYVDPQGPGEAETLDRLLGILDHRDFVGAVIALDRARLPRADEPQSAKIYRFPVREDGSSKP